MIREKLAAVSHARMAADLFHLCGDPLTLRTAAHVRPGMSTSSLVEADRYIRHHLEAAGLTVASTAHLVQAFRCDRSKPLHHWYAPPLPEDPIYDVDNLEVALPGRGPADEIIQLVAHKDSPSWIDSPGAHDNAVGTVTLLEIARVLAGSRFDRTVRLLFCNEEHTPWTSRPAAEAAFERGDRIIAVLNVDVLDGKSDEEMAAGKHTHVAAYSTDEGRPLAELIVGCAARYQIELDARVAFKDVVNDDDGMYIEAGYRAAVMNVGSWPYADSQYHMPGDVPERVSLENLVKSTRLILAAVLELARDGSAGP